MFERLFYKDAVHLLQKRQTDALLSLCSPFNFKWCLCAFALWLLSSINHWVNFFYSDYHTVFLLYHCFLLYCCLGYCTFSLLTTGGGFWLQLGNYCFSHAAPDMMRRDPERHATSSPAEDAAHVEPTGATEVCRCVSTSWPDVFRRNCWFGA